MNEIPAFVFDKRDRETEQFFDSFLLDVFRGQLPNYQTCPETIDIQSTTFRRILLNFRTETDAILDMLYASALARIESGDIESPEAAIQLLKTARWTECNQIITVNQLGEPVVSSIEQGRPGTGSVGGGNPDPDERVHIHSHPATQAFSPPDLNLILKRESPVALLVVSTPKGYYLCFPTRETVSPSQTIAQEDGVEPSDTYKEILRKRYEAIWQDIIMKHGRSALKDFIGEKDPSRGPSAFPQEVSERGIALIALEDALRLSKKYKLGLYYTDSDCQELPRIHQPNLERRMSL